MIEVKPQGDGWLAGDTSYNSRAEAIAAAREQAGAVQADVVRDGQKIGEVRPEASEQIVLLRADGSMVGEIERPPSNAEGPPQFVTLTPAVSNDQAQEVSNG